MRVKLLDGPILEVGGDEFVIQHPFDINVPCHYCKHPLADHRYYISTCIHNHCLCQFFVETERPQARLI